MSARRRSRAALLLGGVAVALFAVSLFGLAGLGAPSGTVAKSNAGLSTAAVTYCPMVVTTTFAPGLIIAHAPMAVHVNVTMHANAPAICSHVERILVIGLPAGCGVGTSATFTCVPQVAGTFHVQTVVFALNTVTPTMDTLVVR